MTKKETAQILAILKAAYPNHYKMTAEEAVGTVGIWCLQFEKMPANIVLMAVNKHISSSTFPPSIHEIKGKIADIHWEAYEILAQRVGSPKLTPQQLQKYEEIYEITKSYKCHNGNEPSLCDMLGSGMLMLSAE